MSSTPYQWYAARHLAYVGVSPKAEVGLPCEARLASALVIDYTAADR
jgi:hypothetical protein